MIRYPPPEAGCWMMTYWLGGVSTLHHCVTGEPAASALGYWPHSGYPPLTGRITDQEVLLTPTMKLSAVLSEMQAHKLHFTIRTHATTSGIFEGGVFGAYLGRAMPLLGKTFFTMGKNEKHGSLCCVRELVASEICSPLWNHEYATGHNPDS